MLKWYPEQGKLQYVSKQNSCDCGKYAQLFTIHCTRCHATFKSNMTPGDHVCDKKA